MKKDTFDDNYYMGIAIRLARKGIGKTSLRDRCGVLRVFLRYLHREGRLPRDLSCTVEAPQVRRLSGIPRSVTWDEVRRMLDAVDRRTIVGRSKESNVAPSGPRR